MLAKKEVERRKVTDLANNIIDSLTQLRSHLSAPLSTPLLVPMCGIMTRLDFYGYLLERTAQLNCVFLSALNVPGIKRFQQRYSKKKKKAKLSLAEVNAQLTEFQKR